MSRPIVAAIDRDALRHNHGVARRHAGTARVWSVVKADGYGHGLLRVAEALADQTDGFALIELDGALALREAGLAQPILMMEGFYAADELPLFAEHRLIPVLHCLEQVDRLERAGLPVRLPVCLKINSGMNRLGFDAAELEAALERLRGAAVAGPISLMSHFADADEERGIAWQLSRFEAMRAGRPYRVTLANSAAAEIGLRPVMTLKSALIGVQALRAGDRVGYGGAFSADHDMRIGVVACGYGDGYPRHAPTGTPILVDGRRTRTLGRVSMDKICVDLDGIPGAGIGSPVTLWGEGLPADEVASAAGTVAYQLFCALAGRVPVSER